MDIVAGQKYPVTVQKIMPIGAIVTIDNDPATYLIHVSNISNSFVKNPADFVSVGRTYIADAIAGKVKPVELSLKALDLKPVNDYMTPNHPPKDPPKIPEFGSSHSPRATKIKHPCPVYEPIPTYDEYDKDSRKHRKSSRKPHHPHHQRDYD